MKSRLFKIVIAAEFESDVDEASLAEGIMQALRSPSVPAGQAKVMVQPLDPKLLAPIPISSLN